MAHRWTNDLTRADVTPEHLFLNRRQIMMGMGGAGLLAAMPGGARAETLEPNSFEDITSYNNYYEFGTSKTDPAKYAHTLTTDPWTVTIDGLVDKPGDYALADILSAMTIEERIYRFRCGGLVDGGAVERV
jgi:sulfoxide reductase catalytic subunit YedY